MDEIIVIDIFGEEFRFKPDNQVENPKLIAQYLKKNIKEAEGLFQHKTSSKNKIAILLLAAMNISLEFHALKVQHAQLEREIQNRISSLNEKIDKGIH
ncbi:MAG: cell division protein ZapA [Pseudomonadota bacterium]